MDTMAQIFRVFSACIGTVYLRSQACKELLDCPILTAQELLHYLFESSVCF